MAEYSEDMMLRRAIEGLGNKNVNNAIVQDIFKDRIYNNEVDGYDYLSEDSGLYNMLFGGQKAEDINLGNNYPEYSEVTKTEEDLDSEQPSIPEDFSYDSYSHPDYLTNVAGKVITMPNGEVRTYSPDGTSYSIPAEPWMGIGDSTYQITTHNKISGQAYPNPSKQYIGLGFNQSEPAIMAAATGHPWWLLGYLPSALGWVMGNNSEEQQEEGE